MNKIGVWIEAMRLRTLPVSVAGVLTAWGFCVLHGVFEAAPAFLCLIFAVLAQIASNFANEYYDYRAGRDRPGREGPRRGVTEGDITPGAMKAATFGTLAAACCVGLSLLIWAPWWYLPAGVGIALGVMAYSTGPYPLSAKGLGEVAVVIFFGLMPVNLTYYIQAHAWSADVAMASLAIGLLGANVLIVNNYRDVEDDRAVGKKTLAVRLGARWMPWLYGLNGLAAVALLWPVRDMFGRGLRWGLIILAFAMVWQAWDMTRLKGSRLTKVLASASLVMLAMALAILLGAILKT